MANALFSAETFLTLNFIAVSPRSTSSYGLVLLTLLSIVPINSSCSWAQYVVMQHYIVSPNDDIFQGLIQVLLKIFRAHGRCTVAVSPSMAMNLNKPFQLFDTVRYTRTGAPGADHEVFAIYPSHWDLGDDGEQKKRISLLVLVQPPFFLPQWRDLAQAELGLASFWRGGIERRRLETWIKVLRVPWRRCSHRLPYNCIHGPTNHLF